MDFDEGKKYFFEGIEILKMNVKVIEKVAKDEKATLYAVIFFALAGLAQAIGTLNLVGIITVPITMVIFSFVGVGILHLLAKLFGGKASFMHFYRACGIGYIAMWVAVVPFIGPAIAGLVGLYYLVVDYTIVKNLYKLPTQKAVLVILIPVVIGLVIMAIMVVAGAMLLGSMYARGIPGLPRF